LTMRRLWVSLLLTFCLVCSQQGALLHELGHYAPHAGASHGVEADSQGPGVGCDVCLAFEHIAGAVATALVLLVLASTAEHWSLTERFALRAGDVPRARARDPPIAF
jgi:hypothetical protein